MKAYKHSLRFMAKQKQTLARRLWKSYGSMCLSTAAFVLGWALLWSQWMVPVGRLIADGADASAVLSVMPLSLPLAGWCVAGLAVMVCASFWSHRCTRRVLTDLFRREGQSAASTPVLSRGKFFALFTLNALLFLVVLGVMALPVVAIFMALSAASLSVVMGDAVATPLSVWLILFFDVFIGMGVLQITGLLIRVTLKV